MNYCRFNEGDVYMYRSIRTGLYICCGCGLINPDEVLAFKTPEEALKHLEEHVAAGHIVAKKAFNRLRKEIEDEREVNNVFILF